MYTKGTDLLEQCAQQKKRISQIVLENESAMQQVTVQQVRDRIGELYDVMFAACTKALNQCVPSLSGLTGGDAMLVHGYENNAKGLCGATLLHGVAYAMSCFEVNTAMGRIVAAPTAGSCGILPGALFAAAERLGASKDQVIDAFANASGIGQIIAYNATISGAEGGCQAECGSASAMAASGIVEMLGGSPETCLHAAAMTLKNVMGLVCDPVAGLVEIPCEKRNAIGVANAFLSADLAMAGVKSNIPFDEVVDAMGKVGKALPMTLRETALGGVAVTPTGLKMREKVFGKK